MRGSFPISGVPHPILGVPHHILGGLTPFWGFLSHFEGVSPHFRDPTPLFLGSCSISGISHHTPGVPQPILGGLTPHFGGSHSILGVPFTPSWGSHILFYYSFRVSNLQISLLAFSPVPFKYPNIQILGFPSSFLEFFTIFYLTGKRLRSSRGRWWKSRSTARPPAR